MTRSEEIELEIRQQAVRLYPKCAALFELPLMNCIDMEAPEPEE